MPERLEAAIVGEGKMTAVLLIDNYRKSPAFFGAAVREENFVLYGIFLDPRAVLALCYPLYPDSLQRLCKIFIKSLNIFFSNIIFIINTTQLAVGIRLPESFMLAPRCYLTSDLFPLNPFLQNPNKTSTEKHYLISKPFTMPFNKSHVQYVLAQFDAGVSPHEILVKLQYRAFLPSINVATIERCIRDNGRVLTDQQTGNATKSNQSRGIGQASHPLPPANQGAPGSSAATQGSSQFPIGFATRSFPTNVDYFDPGPRMPWDPEADKFTLAEYRAKKSGEEIWTSLRSRGYDITPQEIVNSLVRQGVPIMK